MQLAVVLPHHPGGLVVRLLALVVALGRLLDVVQEVERVLRPLADLGLPVERDLFGHVVAGGARGRRLLVHGLRGQFGVARVAVRPGAQAREIAVRTVGGRALPLVPRLCDGLAQLLGELGERQVQLVVRGGDLADLVRIELLADVPGQLGVRDARVVRVRRREPTHVLRLPGGRQLPHALGVHLLATLGTLDPLADTLDPTEEFTFVDARRAERGEIVVPLRGWQGQDLLVGHPRWCATGREVLGPLRGCLVDELLPGDPGR